MCFRSGDGRGFFLVEEGAGRCNMDVSAYGADDMWPDLSVTDVPPKLGSAEMERAKSLACSDVIMNDFAANCWMDVVSRLAAADKSPANEWNN